MKTLVFLVATGFLASAQALTEQQKEKLRPFGRKCLEYIRVSEESIQKDIRGEEVDDPKLRELALCIMKKAGFVNEAGNLQIDFMKTKLKEDAAVDADVDALVDRCAVTKTYTPVTAYETLTCIYT